MDAIFVALTLLALSAVLLVWLRDRLQGEDARHPHTFQRQHSHQTLRQGLEEFYEAGELLPPRGLGAGAKATLRAHDVAHVVFGCDDTARGEIVLTRWSAFGARDALPVYIRGLWAADTRWLFTEFFRKIRPRTLILGVLDGFQALGRSAQMTARWPSNAWEPYLDQSLESIRAEFNIRVV